MKNKEESPLVSIYIITRNRIDLLKRSIDSVLCQTYKNIELIIVDDCSNDGTDQYIKKLYEEGKISRFYSHEQKKGSQVCRRMAIELSSGKYITGLDDDDWFHRNRIECFVSHAEKCELKKVFYFGEDVYWNNVAIDKSCKKLIVSHKELKLRNEVGNQIFMLSSFLKVEIFNLNVSIWQDWIAWLELTKYGYKGEKVASAIQFIDISGRGDRISIKKKEGIVYSLSVIKSEYLLWMDILIYLRIVARVPIEYKINKESFLKNLYAKKIINKYQFWIVRLMYVGIKVGAIFGWVRGFK